MRCYFNYLKTLFDVILTPKKPKSKTFCILFQKMKFICKKLQEFHISERFWGSMNLRIRILNLLFSSIKRIIPKIDQKNQKMFSRFSINVFSLRKWPLWSSREQENHLNISSKKVRKLWGVYRPNKCEILNNFNIFEYLAFIMEIIMDLSFYF